VFATQSLLQRKPKTFAVNVEGQLPTGVTAKDLILAVIGKIGVSGGTGHVFEYRGSAIRALSMDERMTVCNMSIEAGARAGMIAPDDTTFDYLKPKPRVPQGAEWDDAVARWRTLATDSGASFDAAVEIDAAALEPMITYGTNPGMVLPIGGAIPDTVGDAAFDKALQYMGFHGGEAMLGKPVDVVFIGSCTNGRLADMQAAARILKGRKIAPGVRLLIVPGSQETKREAEAAGYADIFKAAGADWRESGCSMCLGMNGDTVAAGQYSISTSNRNFEGRQGVRARTLLASPFTAAASAVRGRITDPREML
jgi:3-isopropylmalate/(R)-2-methylmalate dehydratase large subunit